MISWWFGWLGERYVLDHIGILCSFVNDSK